MITFAAISASVTAGKTPDGFRSRSGIMSREPSEVGCPLASEIRYRVKPMPSRSDFSRSLDPLRTFLQGRIDEGIVPGVVFALGRGHDRAHHLRSRLADEAHGHG